MTNDTATRRQPPAASGRWRSRLLTGALVGPAMLWYVVLLVAPIVFVVVFSFGTRNRTGGYTPGFTFDNYAAVLKTGDPFLTSLELSIAGTILCLLIGLPLAYFIATRARKRKSLLIVLLVIPFWTSFLIRTYAWLLILGPEGIAGFFADLTGNASFRILGTEPGVLLGLVYGYLPLMVFPLYVTLERMDRALVEASKDLGAGRWASFRQVTLPIALPGLITGSILVFIPMMGEYVIPTMLGYGQVYGIGNLLYSRFLEARNWPSGSALGVVLILIMLAVVTLYVWFTNRGRTVRDVSVV
ncbi:MAG: spermidine/putrescine transport system permease protein [Chloroflexota bacterium]|jgi:spermidine/putrescine transport system permease protein|nr:spermidine/putrescine transport system permease protein [Chloroflexota bacterium]